MITVVFLSSPKHFGYDIITNEKDIYFVHKEEDFRFLFYQHPLPSVNLVYKSFLGYEKNKIFCFDRIKGKNSPVSIKDHVNISGKNGLAGQTPFRSHPMFPDMSYIYRPSTTYQKKTVFTVGPKRFCTEKPSKKIISENAGIVTPILNYIGGTVTAFGIPEQMKEKKEIVHKCLKTEALN